MLVEQILHELLRGVLGGLPRAREKGRISDPPTGSRATIKRTHIEKMEHHCNVRPRDGEPILQFFKAPPPSLD